MCVVISFDECTWAWIVLATEVSCRSHGWAGSGEGRDPQGAWYSYYSYYFPPRLPEVYLDAGNTTAGKAI